MTSFTARLQELYHDASKHSSYQNIPHFVSKALGYSETIDEEWRGDTARYKYSLTELDLEQATSVGDVGANTGFFTLSLGHTFPNSTFVGYEANANHVEFIQLVIDQFALANVSVKHCMIDLNGIGQMESHDVVLHLNVLHHAGHDFDADLVKGVEDFEGYAVEYLQRLRPKARTLLFQMGSNWRGIKATPIIQKEDDYGKVIFMSRLLLTAGWEIARIALATKDANQRTTYRNLSEDIVKRIGSGVTGRFLPELAESIREYYLPQFRGEFYRRPIFVCHCEGVF